MSDRPFARFRPITVSSSPYRAIVVDTGSAPWKLCAEHDGEDASTRAAKVADELNAAYDRAQAAALEAAVKRLDARMVVAGLIRPITDSKR